MQKGRWLPALQRPHAGEAAADDLELRRSVTGCLQPLFAARLPQRRQPGLLGRSHSQRQVTDVRRVWGKPGTKTHRHLLHLLVL